jgi:uncharacterized protein involved in tellurium resistance
VDRAEKLEFIRNGLMKTVTVDIDLKASLGLEDGDQNIVPTLSENSASQTDGKVILP